MHTTKETETPADLKNCGCFCALASRVIP